MPDPFDRLRDIPDHDLGVRPLPAAEVRRRGDRMRRRRTVLNATGAALAVAVVASGSLLVNQDGVGTAPGPGPATQRPSILATPTAPRSPTPDAAGRVTTIPAGMSIADGLPEPGGDNPEREETHGPSTPWMLDPCRDGGLLSDGNRTDFLGLEQPVPAGTHARQLGVYPRDIEAGTAVAQLRVELGECQRSAAEPGAGEARRQLLDAEVAGADETVSVVEHVYTGDARTALATHYLAVRVGNAVLMVVTEGEFGGSDTALQETASEAGAAATAIASRMCVFSAGGCRSGDETPEKTPDSSGDGPTSETTARTPGGPSGGPSGGSGQAPPELSEANLVAAGELPPLEEVGPWRAVEPQSEPTLACQAAWLSSLGADELRYREFRTPTEQSSYPLAKVNTAVLAFESRDAAGKAYATVTGWVQTCRNRVDDSRPMAYNEEKPVRPSIGRGRALWRNVHLAAPEVCQECDAVWFDRQGVAILGDRLVLVSLARLGGPLEPEGLDAAMNRTLRTAVRAGRL